MATKKEPTFFLISYRDVKDNQIISLKVKKIEDSTLGLSFIKISDFIFDTQSVIAQPIEEQLKKRFENVKSMHLSIYSILSIEELGMKHVGLKFNKDKSNLVTLPTDFSTIRPI